MMTTDSQRDLLTQIFHTQRRSLIGTLYRMVGCLATAEDLAHDAYLRVSKAARERPVTHLQAFLYQTARNLALDHLRRERIRGGFMSETADGTTDAVPAPQPGPEATVMNAELLHRVEDALNGRSSATRTMSGSPSRKAGLYPRSASSTGKVAGGGSAHGGRSGSIQSATSPS